MPLAKLLEDAAERMEVASAVMDEARERPASVESLTEWLAALTDFAHAIADIQSYNNESVHEKLQEISRRAKLGDLGPGQPKHK